MKEYAKAFYKSAAWKRARLQVIARANGLCERCLAKGIYTPGYIVHHKEYITPGNINNTRVTLSLDNLEYVCEDCHNKEHKAKSNTRYRFDANGNILPPVEQVGPRVSSIFDEQKEPRELPQKNSARSHAYEGGLGYDRKKGKYTDNYKKKSKQINKCQDKERDRIFRKNVRWD